MNKNVKNALLSVTAAAGVFAAGSAVANADTVTVKPGDTVSDIAAKNHTTIAAIEKANKLSDVDFILPGQKLDIDGDGNVKVVEQPKQTQASVRQAAPAQAPAQKQQVQAQPKAQAPVQKQQAQAQPKAQAPVQKQQVQAQPKAQTSAPVQQAAQPQQHKAPVQTHHNSGSSLSSSEEAARQFIVGKESGGNYNAKNGLFRGAYQLSDDKLGGDYSRANQDRVANQYVHDRYGSWSNAKTFWNEHNYY